MKGATHFQAIGLVVAVSGNRQVAGPLPLEAGGSPSLRERQRPQLNCLQQAHIAGKDCSRCHHIAVATGSPAIRPLGLQLWVRATRALGKHCLRPQNT